MRWLITGATGMVGTAVHDALRARDADTVAVGREELDIADRDAVLYLAKQIRPDVIVNCAAFTRVDDCEAEEPRAMLVNGTAVGFLAEAANRWDSLLAHLSTDFVFDGRKSGEYEPDDPVAPISAYGRTKLLGEREAAKAEKHLIIRTSWLFGAGGWNFVEAILRQVEQRRRELRVVDDQRGKPTWTPHLAGAIVLLCDRVSGDSRTPHLVHYADEPACSWFDFASAILELSNPPEPVTITPVASEEFPRPAARPANSALSTARYEQLTGEKPGSWREGLSTYLRDRLTPAGSEDPSDPAALPRGGRAS